MAGVESARGATGCVQSSGWGSRARCACWRSSSIEVRSSITAGRSSGSSARHSASSRGERGGYAGEVVLAAPDPVHDRHRRTLAVRRPAGRRERHGRRPGVYVGGDGRVVAVQDLGREVAGRAQQPAGLGQPRVLGHPGQPEVDQHRRASLHQHVGRLDVAVQHPDGVHRLEGLGQCVGEVEQVGPGDRALLVDVVVEREPGHVAGHHERHRTVRVGVQELGDARARDPLQRADLAGQPLARLAVADDVRAQHLESDPLAVRPLREVHHSHAALADRGQQPVGTDDGRAGCRLGRGRHSARLPKRRSRPAERPDPGDAGCAASRGPRPRASRPRTGSGRRRGCRTGSAWRARL